MSPRTLTVSMLLALVAAACTSGPAADDPLGDGIWRLLEGSVDGEALVLVDGYQVTLSIDGETAGGRAACNLYGATLERAGDQISFRDLHQTAAFCPTDGVMELEVKFITALLRAQAAVLDEGHLLLTGDGIRLRFEEVPPEPDQALRGTHWSLDTLLVGAAASTPAALANLLITEDGTVTGFTGCNSLFGTFDTETGFHDLTMTRIACADDIMRQEAHFVEVLNSQPSLTVAGATLTVTAPDGRGMVFRATS